MKWQSILSYSTGGTIGILLLLTGILNLSGISYSVSEDIFCTECYSEIKINSTYWEIKVEHAEDKDIIFKKFSRSRTLWINLDKIDEFLVTEPRVKTEILVPATSSTATIKHEKYGYLRNLKDGDVLISRGQDRFVIYGNKPINLTVKWSFNIDDSLIKAIKIDPTWYGLKVTYLQDCSTKRERQNLPIYSLCSINQIVNYQDNITFSSYSFVHIYNFTCQTDEYINIINTTTCRDVGVELEGSYGKVKIENWEKLGYKCNLNDFDFCCDSCFDGNCNGIITSGESGFCYDIRNLTTTKERKDIPSLKDVKFK